MGKLSNVFQHRLSQEKADIYFEHLKHLPDRVFEKAIDGIIRRERSFPTIAHIIDESFGIDQYLPKESDYSQAKRILPDDQPFILIYDPLTRQKQPHLISISLIESMANKCKWPDEWHYNSEAKIKISPCMQFAADEINEQLCSDDDQWKCAKSDPYFRRFEQTKRKAEIDAKTRAAEPAAEKEA